ncbi:MAG: carbon-nitrogen hydrolase family protein [Acidilobaceae archaeon]|nr:carbon-nitrogen hydrolase family protein [Acidilobaceae archaeon]MCX8165209.1 carbon-nitrogen hydrolase family protein [Acidilobaceae archaeon]MDW7974275.1 carbon-nitrogen hydrolase family protein [Sulfolobales archaeon]
MRVTIAQIGLSERPLEALKKALRGEELGDLVLLPEHWFSATRSGRSIEEYEEAVLKIRQELGVEVLGGLNTVRDRDGELRSIGLAAVGDKVLRVCEKVHPSKATGERELVRGGRLLPPLQIGKWSIGCIACVDIFYPEIARGLVSRGANVLYNPSSITLDRVEGWLASVRARAEENVAYAIGVNSVGNRYPDGRVTGGTSAVFSPYGRVKALLPNAVGAVTVSLRAEEVEEALARWAFREDFEKHYSHLYKS